MIVHSADVKDPAATPQMIEAVREVSDRMRHVWADMGYRSVSLRAWLAEHCTWTFEIVNKPRRWGRYPADVEPPPMPAFTVLARRWVVERTFAWIGRYRRMSKDYEYLPSSSEAMVYLAMTRLMLRRLARDAPYGVPSPQRLGLRGIARAF